MRATATAEERDLIERVLRFANLSKISTTTQVERLFAEAVSVQAGGVFQIIEFGNVAAYQGDQRALRDALDAIASGKEIRREKVRQRVNGILARVVSVTVGLHRGRFVVGYRVDGVEAACWLAVAWLLDEGRGLLNRLGRCGDPACGRFNLRFTGRPQRHCSEAHRVAFASTTAADRVRRSRARAGKLPRSGGFRESRRR